MNKAKTNQELKAEYDKHMEALDDLTNGLGISAYLHANSARKAFRELIDRGYGHLISNYAPRAGDPPQHPRVVEKLGI